MTEYPKRIYVPVPPLRVDGVLTPRPPLSVLVKNADEERRWRPEAITPDTEEG